MSERQPDIEIYLKRPAFDDISAWLQTHFDINAVTPQGPDNLLDLSFNNQRLQCLIIARVAKGGYASVWFKQNNTPWRSDLECAEDAHVLLDVETRCSVGGWHNSREERGGWYRLSIGEKSIVNWLA